MKVAVSASGPDLGSPVDPRFGRCQYLTIVDTDTMEFESTPNLAAMASGGAGIQAAQLVVQKGARVVLTGRCGPNAYQVFQANGVEVIQGVTGTVEAAVERYKQGDLSSVPQPAMPAFPRYGGFARQPQTRPRAEAVRELEEQVREAKARLDKLTQALEELRGKQ